MDLQTEIDRAWSDYNAAMTKLRQGIDQRAGAQAWENRQNAAYARLVQLGAVSPLRQKYQRGEHLKQVR